MSLYAFSLVALASLLTYDLAVAKTIRGFSPKKLSEEQGFIICRMTVLGTTYEDEGGNGLRTEGESACVPVVDGRELDDLIPISLPSNFEQTHSNHLKEGWLLVNVTNAAIGDGDISTSDSTEFSVIDNAPGALRHLQERQLRTTGRLSIAIIRIISRDGVEPTAKESDFNAIMNGNQVNLRTQMEKCSIGQFRLTKAKRFVINVRVDERMSELKRGAVAVAAASKKLLSQFNIGQVSDLADRVLFCVPPGTGNWAASAGMNHWKAQFNDGFCTSLSATMHELGHTLGLPHSNEGGVKYGDRTGYMSKSYRNPNWPSRCFNGANSAHFGWYDRKTLTLDGHEKPQLVFLGNVVDYDRAKTVMVRIKDYNLVVMFNRAKGFNRNTG